MKRLANLRQQLAGVHNSTSWRVAAPLRFVSRMAIWLAAGLWAWITLKPGSRPRRAARRTVEILAKRRGLVVAGKMLLAPFPAFRERLQDIVRPHRGHGLGQASLQSPPELHLDQASNVTHLALPANQPDLSAEPEGVQRIYRRLSWARKRNLINM
jgi:hypothetical protein